MVKISMQRIIDVCPRAEVITSRANPLVVSLGKLSDAKHRVEQALFLAEGVKLSREAAGMTEIRYLLLRSDDGMADDAVLSIVHRAPASARIIILPSQVFAKISTENAPQGIITVLSPLRHLHVWETTADSKRFSALRGRRVLAVDSVQNPGNLGTIIRTAAAFGYTRILLGGCADIYHPKTVRASMGALFRMEIDVCRSLQKSLSALRDDGHRILSAALSDNSLSLGSDSLQKDDCVVIGNEGHGVSEEVLTLSDGVLRIPMAQGTESLNAAGASAVLMWEYFKTFG